MNHIRLPFAIKTAPLSVSAAYCTAYSTGLGAVRFDGRLVGLICVAAEVVTSEHAASRQYVGQNRTRHIAVHRIVVSAQRSISTCNLICCT